MKQLATRLILALALIFFANFGCSSSVDDQKKTKAEAHETTPSAPAKASSSICNLLNPDEITSVTGRKVRQGRPRVVKYGSGTISASCLYWTDDAPKSSFDIQIQISNEAFSPMAMAGRYITDTLHIFGPSYVLQKIDGIGEAALWEPKASQLVVFFEHRLLRINVPLITDHDARLAKVIILAKKLLSLPNDQLMEAGKVMIPAKS